MSTTEPAVHCAPAPQHAAEPAAKPRGCGGKCGCANIERPCARRDAGHHHAKSQESAMRFEIDKSLHWTDHYVEYGFAVVKGLVGEDFVKPALEEVRRAMGHGLPLQEWSKANTPVRSPIAYDDYEVLPTIYDYPAIRDMIDTMFGSPDEWDRRRHYQLFVSPYDPEAPAAVAPTGHVDFVECPIPIFGSGFIFQVSLVKSEPFSGNITIYPGTHKKVQRALVEDPDLRFPSNPFFRDAFRVPPFEFVAEPGDVLLFHHLVGHAGNTNHAANRSPRVGLHCQATRKAWLRELDPSAADLSPWQRSLAFTGGPYRTRRDEEEWVTEFARTRHSKPKPVGAY